MLLNTCHFKILDNIEIYRSVLDHFIYLEEENKKNNLDHDFAFMIESK